MIQPELRGYYSLSLFALTGRILIRYANELFKIVALYLLTADYNLLAWLRISEVNRMKIQVPTVDRLLVPAANNKPWLSTRRIASYRSHISTFLATMQRC